MKASIVVATRDRGAAIDETIESLLGVHFDEDCYEIVLVDNRSDNESEAHLRLLAGRHPERILYRQEDRLGLSNARNCGVRSSRGRIVVFVDDDAIVPVDWLTNLVRPFDDDARIMATGGKVIARFSSPPPGWLDDRLRKYISTFDLGNEPRLLHYNEYPRGVNMAVRREAFEQVGPFLDSFGRKGESLMSYEEIELCYRIEQAGGRVLYVPDAEVYHLIRGDRLDEAWFEQRHYWQGMSEALFERIHRGPAHVLRRLPLHLGGAVLRDRYGRRHSRGYVVSALRHLPQRRFE